jgi:hypothetical protein
MAILKARFFYHVFALGFSIMNMAIIKSKFFFMFLLEAVA